MVVLSGISSFVFLFIYIGTMSSMYLNVLLVSILVCYFSMASAEAIRMKKESERLSRFVKRMK